MVQAYATCLLTGKNFSPKKLSEIAGLKFSDPTERGERDKNTKQILPYGTASIPECSVKLSLDAILEVLIKYYDSIHLCRVEDIDLTLYLAYKGQCNWYIEPQELKK